MRYIFNFVTLLVFLTVVTVSSGINRVLISQDFEDTQMFNWATQFGFGMGDGASTVGYWASPYNTTENWSPKILFANSDFSGGGQAFECIKSYQYGAGSAAGFRTDDAIADTFLFQFSIRMGTDGARFSMNLTDSANLNSALQGCPGFRTDAEGLIGFKDSAGDWTAAEYDIGLTAGLWVRFRMAGSIASGTWSLYSDTGDGWQLVKDGMSFMNISDVAGFIFYPYVEGETFVIDDIILADAALPLTTCSQAVLMGDTTAYDVNDDCYINIGELGAIADSWLECMDPADELNCISSW
jgi:hypothetical protein